MHPTPTVEAAAEVAGVSPDRIVKSLLFLIDKHPVLVIASGLGRIDRRLLAQHFGINRRKTHFAKADVVQSPDGVPGRGGRRRWDTAPSWKCWSIPRSVEHPVVFGGGGSDSALLQIDPQVILKHNQAKVVPLQKAAEEWNDIGQIQADPI